MDRKTFLGYLAACAVAPTLACGQASAARQRDEIVITVHKDPG